MAIDLTNAETRLKERRRELIELQEISRDSNNTVELDQQSVGRLSRMDAMQVQAMAQEQTRRREFDLVRIEAALRRIKDDDYGYCLECGEEVASGRLEVDPMATLCITCAGLHERK